MWAGLGMVSWELAAKARGVQPVHHPSPVGVLLTAVPVQYSERRFSWYTKCLF